MTRHDDLLAAQQRYYSDYAPGYAAWIRDYVAPCLPEMVKAIQGARLTGHVLELAAGSGEFTAILSGIASRVTALDGSAEMLEILGARELANVTTVQHDIFTWSPARTWDHIFMANWLAHVPPDLLTGFFGTLGRALRDGGTIVILDVTDKEKFIERRAYTENGVPLIERPVDGSLVPVVKVFWDPDDLLAVLRGMGWAGTATPIGESIQRGFVLYRLWRR